jgi:hypothetical protein
LASSIPIRVGTLLFLSFKLPADPDPVRLVGQVVRVSYPREGMGIRFVDLSAAAQQKLSTFLKTA